MDKLKLIKFAGIALIMQPYLADGQGISKCTYGPDVCSCETNNGKIQLKSKGTPYSVPDSQRSYYTYYWDPCKDFTKGTVTSGAIQNDDPWGSTDIGDHKAASSDAASGYAMFHMKSADGYRSTHVKCVCGSGDTFRYENENPYSSFNFNFTSNDCCPFSGTGGISAGTILIIITVSLLAAYILFGTLFQVFVRKAQGRERIPNVTLWSSLPGLIKDGFLFIVRRGNRTGYTST